MKFALFSLVANLPNPRTGEHLTAAQKFEHVIRQAVLAEALGFEAYGVGERHGAPFLSSSPPVLLTATATRTQQIRLLTTVAVLGLSEAEQHEQVERFATEVAPVLRREIPSTVWAQASATQPQTAFAPQPGVTPVFQL